MTEHASGASARSGLAKIVDEIEEIFIAIILALMTIITFANVIARYVFNSNILWALELTVFLFAWLVLIGVSYCVKHSGHLGVDVLINFVSPPVRKVLALLAVAACLAFCALLLVGSWNYWYPFATERAFLETDDVPMPDFLQFLAAWLNEGEAYEKIPRFIPYLALPLGMALLTYRYLQAAYAIFVGKSDRLIASHEAEEAIEMLAQQDGTADAAPARE